jgi:hypothetical protein
MATLWLARTGLFGLVAALLVPCQAQASPCAPVCIVDSTLDGTDSVPGNGVCDDGAGRCTLRAAIAETSALPGPDTIHFNIAPGGLQTITPGSLLPSLADVVIDGTTQPGFGGTPLIEIDGSLTLPGTPGFFVTGVGHVTIRGLIINRFPSHGIRELSTGGNNVIAGTFIGTDSTGTVALGNFRGVSLEGSGGNSLIGGSNVADRNLISGNAADGILVFPSSLNRIEGNYIGTDVSGTLPLGNGGGVSIRGDFGQASTDNVVGGTTPGAGNVISANVGFGVVLQGPDGSRNVVQGNLIGVQADGVSPLGNGQNGVLVAFSTFDNLVGGTGAGAGNVIAFNAVGHSLPAGILAGDAGAGNAFLSNAVHSNAGLGIDLGTLGVTPDDPGDPDTGPNGLQNFPVLTSVSGGLSSTTVQGTLNGAASTTFRIELFLNTACDPSGNGEGETFLGFSDETTDGTGETGRGSDDAYGPGPPGEWGPAGGFW